jgi:hypothetical protein
MTFSELLCEAMSKDTQPRRNVPGKLSQAEVTRLSKLLEPDNGA